MAAAVVNSAHLINASAVASPVTTGTLGFTPTVGNVLYVVFRTGGQSAAAGHTLSDSINGAYTGLGTLGSQSTIKSRWFNVTVGTATAPTFTITWTGGNANWLLMVIEVSGSNGEDVVGAAAGGSGTAPVATAVVATQADLLLGSFVSGSTTWTSPLDNAAGNAMTVNLPPSGSLSGAITSLASVAPGSYAPRATISFNAWIATALLIKDDGVVVGTGLSPEETVGAVTVTTGPVTVALTGLLSSEELGAIAVSVGAPPSGQPLASIGILSTERLGASSLSLQAAAGVAVHHLLSDRPLFEHAVSDGG